jgi:hypothetical protein
VTSTVELDKGIRTRLTTVTTPVNAKNHMLYPTAVIAPYRLSAYPKTIQTSLTTIATVAIMPIDLPLFSPNLDSPPSIGIGFPRVRLLFESVYLFFVPRSSLIRQYYVKRKEANMKSRRRGLITNGKKGNAGDISTLVGIQIPSPAPL